MSSPEYFLRIVRADGTPVTTPFRPFKHEHGTLEVPIVANMAAKLGRFTTRARAIVALQEAIQELKDAYIPLAGVR